jgi:hypothetical protein
MERVAAVGEQCPVEPVGHTLVQALALPGKLTVPVINLLHMVRETTHARTVLPAFAELPTGHYRVL